MTETYITKDGFQSLCNIRIGTPPPVTEGVKSPVTLLAALPSEDCGCPEELWRIGTVEMLIHMEQNGDGHILLFTGDDDREWIVAARDMNDLRAEMFSHLSAYFAGVTL